METPKRYTVSVPIGSGNEKAVSDPLSRQETIEWMIDVTRDLEPGGAVNIAVRREQ